MATKRAPIREHGRARPWDFELSRRKCAPAGLGTHGLKFHHLEKEVVDWTKLYEGDMVFDLNKLDLEGRRRLYMITEVIFSDGLSISVKANDVEFEDVIPARVPVAFSYTRFPIDKHGIIKPALKTKIDIEATFESPDSVF